MPQKHDSMEEEIVVCDTLFKYNLVRVDSNCYTLVVTPCNTPTAVYDVATIRIRSNTCTGLTYYQAFVNSDPVEIIQDCSLCEIIRRAIEIYFANMETITCSNNNNNCNNCNRFFGLF